jgi:hypothetical protein
VTYNAHLLHQFQIANWTNYAEKTVWLVEAMTRLGKRDVFWIDDEAVPLEDIEAIRVNPKGAHELVAVQAQLDQLLGFLHDN